MSFKHVVLTKKMRAADDPMQCETIERFSLKNKNPPITQEIINNFQYLNPDLLRADPSFKDAAIAVQSNQERLLFGKMKAIEIAKENNEPVFSCVSNIQTDQTGGDNNRAQLWIEVRA